MLALGLLWSKIQKTLQFGTDPDMIEKISGGVLRLLTPLGPRYIQPSFSQRLYLLWIFRNFDTLPHQVLTGRQRRLVETLCAGQRYVANGLEDAAVIGTLERRPPMEATLPPRRPASSVSDSVTPFAADIQQRS